MPSLREAEAETVAVMDDQPAISQAPPPDWYAPLRSVASLGSQTAKPACLAEFAATRAITLSQFFTPEPVVALLWSLVQPAIDRYRAEYTDRQIDLLDNSFGSGRLFSRANPAHYRLLGCEVHAPLVEEVAAAVAAAGFEHELVSGSMDEVRINDCQLGLINPPFSLHLDSPTTQPFESGSYGAYGLSSSHRSHLYALEQAREACEIVGAIMPASFLDEALSDPHWRRGLHAVYRLPSNAFTSEGATVATAIVIYGSHAPETPRDVTLRTLTVQPDDLPVVDFHQGYRYRKGTIARVGLQPDQPVITAEVTGIPTVRLTRCGRRLAIGTQCGLMEARVWNQVLGERLSTYRKPEERLPRGVKFSGQGVLDLENHLAQPDPIASFTQLVGELTTLGADVQPDPGIVGWLRKAARRRERQRVPLRHVVKDSEESDAEWTVAHAGLRETEPVRWREVETHALRLGIDRWMTWKYQWDDLIELAVRRGGVIAAWSMGLGKARLAIALCLLGQGRRNLIVVEPRLVSELVIELHSLAAHGLLPSSWQVLTKAGQLTHLRTINVISYTTLKKAVNGSEGGGAAEETDETPQSDVTHARSSPGSRLSRRATFASRLRRRIHTCLCDEGHCLRNPASEQTRAVARLSPKVRYILSGTPIANYPRDILPLLQWVAGDGTARQVYGIRHPYLTPIMRQDCSKARRGVDVFRQRFVTTVWVTNEFAEDLRSGAKREIPTIADVPGFRDLLAPFVKRRVLEEPEVAAWVKTPTPTSTVTTVPWDMAHLRFYSQVSEQFALWYRQREADPLNPKAVNLATILAKLLAVQQACNVPQAGAQGFAAYEPLTSKQRWCLDRLETLTADGHTTICFAHSPQVLDLFRDELAKRGVRALCFHGGTGISERVSDLEKHFRSGDVRVLLASYGACQTGYNLHQADRVVLYDRDWTPKTEQQAIARVLRPQQRRPVHVEYLHLEGSIDCYQAQLVAAKATAVEAGLDHQESSDEPNTFLTMDTILGRFVNDIEQRMGLSLDALPATSSQPPITTRTKLRRQPSRHMRGVAHA